MKTYVLCLALFMLASAVNAGPSSFVETSIQQNDTTPLANGPSCTRCGGDAARGADGAGALRNACHNVTLKLLQEQSTSETLREDLRLMKLNLEERDKAIHSLRHSLNERMPKLEERLNALENQLIPSKRGDAAAGRQVSIDMLENRIQKLEASVEGAMEQALPDVATLIAPLERHSHPEENSSITLISTALSNSTNLLASVSATSSTSTISPTASPSTSPRPPTASAPGATASGGTVAFARQERLRVPKAREERRARYEVRHRIQEVRAKRDRARAAPSPLGDALCKAAKGGSRSDVRRLLDSGADVNYTDSYGGNPLMNTVLSIKANVDKVQLLLERGADPNAMNGYGWSPPLHFVAHNECCGRIFVLLIGAGADVDARDVNGATPLHWAAFKNNEAGVRALLAAGARKSLRCWRGRWRNKTPFDLADSDAMRDLLRP